MKCFESSEDAMNGILNEKKTLSLPLHSFSFIPKINKIWNNLHCNTAKGEEDDAIPKYHSKYVAGHCILFFVVVRTQKSFQNE